MEIVLVNPEIPQNTGSIARTCAATKTPLHLIRPMKFEIDEKKVRRAGLDYWPYVDLTIHDSWEAYIMFKRKSTTQEGRQDTLWCVEEFGDEPYDGVTFAKGDSLIFGPETTGLTPEFITSISSSYYRVDRHTKDDSGDIKVRTIAIPMAEPGVRSLNLSNAVAIVLYEARRQLRLDHPFHKRDPKSTNRAPD